jgi:NADH-quinone oxidoreductase subunit G
VNIEINGKIIEAQAGQMIIEVADANNIRIPRFCYHKHLSVAANCRMCLVEVEKLRKPVPACATPVTDGMKVMTRSPEALKAQRAVMEFLLINHPLDCPVCDQGGECELQDLSMGYGDDISRYQEGKRSVADQDIGPLVETEMTRCIQCTRCVRFGTEISGMRELGGLGRGEFLEIGTFVQKHVNSELSGNIIDLCPVGALTNKPARFTARTWELKQHASIAPHDCVGSHLYVHERRQVRKRVVPKECAEINQCWISDRDRYSLYGLDSQDRLTQPMIKVEGAWQITDWTTALEKAVDGLQRVIHAHGEGAVAGLASPSESLENLYMMQRCLRGLGVNNLDHRLRQHDFSDQQAFPLYPGLDFAITDIQSSDAIFLIGSHLRKEQPMIWHRVHQAWMEGAKVSWVNPLDFDLIIKPHHKFIPEQGDLVAALEEALASEAFIQGLKQSTLPLILIGALALNHPDAALIRALAQKIQDATGARIGLLTEGGNAAGAWIAGMLPHRQAAGVPAPAHGLNAQEMFAQGRKAYVLLGVEPEYDCGNPHQAIESLKAAEFVLSIASFTTPALFAYADLILPAAPFTEVSGTLVNAEGKWQRFNASVPPAGEARPAWKIFRVLAELSAVEGIEAYTTLADVTQEIQQLTGDQPNNTVTWAMPGHPHSRLDKKGLIRIAEMPMYAIDPIIRRSAPLQATYDAQYPHGLHLSEALATELGVLDGDEILVIQGEQEVALPAVIDKRIPNGTVTLAQGLNAHSTLGAGYEPIEIKRVNA